MKRERFVEAVSDCRTVGRARRPPTLRSDAIVGDKSLRPDERKLAFWRRKIPTTLATNQDRSFARKVLRKKKIDWLSKDDDVVTRDLVASATDAVALQENSAAAHPQSRDRPIRPTTRQLSLIAAITTIKLIE